MQTLDAVSTELDQIQKHSEQDFQQAKSLQELNEFRVKYLGEKSFLSQARKMLKDLSKEERPKFGQMINQAQAKVEEVFKECLSKLEEEALSAKLNSEQIDVSMPALGTTMGHIHPLEQVTEEIIEIFETMGFNLVDGPEIENTYYVFTALNTPENHPARDEQDTFYTKLNPDVLLRSHTSSIQIRAMERLKPPFRIIGHGRVYRNEEVNARKMPFFHQLEVMMVDKDVNFGHLKWVLQNFLSRFFGEDVVMRLRPDFFPFTEPSAELDVQCVFCKGAGCTTCGGRGWLELMGCGMVDPNVLRMAGIDPEIYSGFAAGMGLDRFTMLKYRINDIRYMFNGDQRFLKQF